MTVSCIRLANNEWRDLCAAVAVLFTNLCIEIIVTTWQLVLHSVSAVSLPVKGEI